MNNTTTAKALSHEKLSRIISGDAEGDLDASRFYLRHLGDGTQIKIENYEVAADTGGVFHIQDATSPLLLIFRDCIIKEMEINSEINTIIFENCEIGRLMFAEGKIGKLTISQESGRIGKITIKNGTVEEFDFHCNVGRLIFETAENKIDGSIRGEIDFIEIQGGKDISMTAFGLIRECSILSSVYPFRNAPVTIQHLKMGSCGISAIELCGLFESIELASVSGPVYINSVICLRDFKIRGNKGSTTKIGLTNTYIGGDFTISNALPDLATTIDGENNQFIYINKLLLTRSLMALDMSIGGETPIRINHICFKKLAIAKEVSWNIQGLSCQMLDFIDFRNSGTGSIFNAEGGNFKPLEFTYGELLELGAADILNAKWISENIQSKEGISATKMLYMQSSDLGKINFIDADFSNFKLSFYSTKLNEIFLAGSKMPKAVGAINIGLKIKEMKHQERIAYSQLKKLHEQQGDLLASNEYFAGEMNAYYESIGWKDDFCEKLPLFLNRVSSNHGQSWIRALLSTVLVTGLFYMFFLFSLGILPADAFKEQNLRHFTTAVSYFFDFVNPLHKLDTFAPLKTGDDYPVSARFLDGIARIFIAYFVYQLIQAFRKHGRSR